MYIMFDELVCKNIYVIFNNILLRMRKFLRIVELLWMNTSILATRRQRQPIEFSVQEASFWTWKEERNPNKLKKQSKQTNKNNPKTWRAISSEPMEIWNAWMLTCLQKVLFYAYLSFLGSYHRQFHPCQKYNKTQSRSCRGLVTFTGSLSPQIWAQALFLSKEQHLASSCAHLHANTGLLSQRTAI